MAYSFWNDFVKHWSFSGITSHSLIPTHFGTHFFDEWSNPNDAPMLNSDLKNDYSLKYIPEPWWGNDGSEVLNSVVVNYNPGKGGLNQLNFSSIGLYGFVNYQLMAGSEGKGITNHFNLTNNWHRVKRANPIYNALIASGIILGANTKLKNHLSVELIPWHTKNISNINGYIELNLNSVFFKSLMFAAEESKRVENIILKNKVIFRVSGARTLKILDLIAHASISGYTITKPQTNFTDPYGSVGCMMKFKFDKIQDVEFISIWGPKSRNDFPSNHNMVSILSNI